MKKIKTCLLGFGFSGSTFHAPFINDLEMFDFKYVISKDCEKVYSKYSNVIVLSSIHEIKDRKDIELIIITSPNNMHFEHAMFALDNGINVILEKPFAINVEQCLKLMKKAEEKSVILSIFHNRRWDNGFLSLKKMFDSNIMGDIFDYQAYFDRYRPQVNKQKWKENDGEGTGVLYDLGSHLIDQALCLFGLPDELYADLECQRKEADAIDYFKIVMYYGKLRVTLGSSSFAQIPRPILSVFSENVSFIKYGLDPQEEDLKNGKSILDLNWGKMKELEKFELQYSNVEKSSFANFEIEKGSYQEFFREFYRCVQLNESNPVSPLEATNCIYIIEKCIESNNFKKRIKIEPLDIEF